MPRATQTPASKVLDAFKSLELPVAQLLLDLAIAAMKERQTKSQVAKARAALPAAKVAAQTKAVFKPAPAAPKAKAKKKAAKPAAIALRRKTDKPAPAGPTPA